MALGLACISPASKQPCEVSRMYCSGQQAHAVGMAGHSMPVERSPLDFLMLYT